MAEKKLWGGRFAQATNPAVERFSASIHFDKALARYDIRGSIAHARMLEQAGLLSEEDALTLVGGCRKFRRSSSEMSSRSIRRSKTSI